MRFAGAIAAMTFIAVLGSSTGSALTAGEGKGSRHSRGTNASDQRSGKSIWSADPERGWVRTNERRNDRDVNDRGEGKGGKKKDKGKGKKS
jgi:hypothetical protein